MSDDPSPQEKLAQQILSGGPIVAEVTKALSAFFDSTFAALSADVEAMVKTNAGPDALTGAVNTLTRDMIKLLQQRVHDAFPAAKSGEADQDATAPDPEG